MREEQLRVDLWRNELVRQSDCLPRVLIAVPLMNAEGEWGYLQPVISSGVIKYIPVNRILRCCRRLGVQSLDTHTDDSLPVICYSLACFIWGPLAVSVPYIKRLTWQEDEWLLTSPSGGKQWRDERARWRNAGSFCIRIKRERERERVILLFSHEATSVHQTSGSLCLLLIVSLTDTTWRQD